MPITNFAPVVILAFAAIFGYMIWNTTFQKKEMKTRFLWVIAIVAVYGLVGVGSQLGFIDLGDNSGIFLATTGVVAPTIVDGVVIAPAVEGARTRPISTLSVISTAKNSNSRTTIAGTLRIFDPEVNPSDPTASATDTITLTSGVGSTTNKYIKTDTPYRVVFDGDGTYYDKDYGVITFPDRDFNPSTGEFLFDLEEVVIVATIDDMLDESDVTGLVNGQSTNVTGTAELGFVAADSLMYDESVGDGQYYIKPTLSASGAYTELKQGVLCFEWDTTNPPEGNEYSSITYQLQSGTDLGIDSELINFWSTEECVALGDMIGGASSTIKLTFTLDESATDANDVFYLGFDDLGALRGKDLNLDTGATLDRMTFDHQD